ncbi:MAG: cytochrome c3 family protein [Gemmatimonadales bacterium]|nr:cytochrome c3 family protein [Gemmatimonadales bacterium]
MTARRLVATLAVALAALLPAPLAAQARAKGEGFDHWQHRKLFTACQSCHAGAEVAGRALWPTAQSCASCHDGKVEEKVSWAARAGRAPGNLRFEHAAHGTALARATRADSIAACTACHQAQGAGWMRVERAPVSTCADCHALPREHWNAPDSTCATCHVPFAEQRLADARIRAWKAPASHESPDFAGTGHGRQARPPAGATYAVNRTCATCHARDYCLECHVNAPEEPTIAALPRDARARLVKAGERKAPASHAARTFQQEHGRVLLAKGGRRAESAKSCQVCHTQESCVACHVAPVRATRVVLPVAGPDRAKGVQLLRRRPVEHGQDFTDIHAGPANARLQGCYGCHARPQCLDCHRPNPAAANQYHPADFITRHPRSAYQREIACASCHNTGNFCQTCHQQSGVVSAGSGVLGDRRSFHDAFPGFSQGHGQVARQSLESCVSCHSERDCLSCHSLIQGRRVSPHGPNFPAERLRAANVQMCSVCHGANVPGGN